MEGFNKYLSSDDGTLEVPKISANYALDNSRWWLLASCFAGLA
jgi:hypothetical protein